jgi:hypothetical protein
MAFIHGVSSKSRVQAPATTVWAYQRGREALLSRTEGAVAELIPLPSGYPALLEDLKTTIRAAQLRVSEMEG